MAGAKCNACGRYITWAKDAAGKNIPLQRVEAIELRWSKEGEYEARYVAIAVPVMRETYVVHFQYCPGAKS